VVGQVLLVKPAITVERELVTEINQHMHGRRGRADQRTAAQKSGRERGIEWRFVHLNYLTFGLPEIGLVS
jgi:hypothetical protein